MKRHSTTEVRNSFAEMIEQACQTGEPVIIERRKKPLVALVPLAHGGESKVEGGLELPTLHLGPLSTRLSRKDIYGEGGR